MFLRSIFTFPGCGYSCNKSVLFFVRFANREGRFLTCLILSLLLTFNQLLRPIVLAGWEPALPVAMRFSFLISRMFSWQSQKPALPALVMGRSPVAGCRGMIWIESMPDKFLSATCPGRRHSHNIGSAVRCTYDTGPTTRWHG